MLVNYGDTKTVYLLDKNDESILDVAIHSGMRVEDIWNFDDPTNKELKEKRKIPFWVMKGDFVAVPKKEIGEKKEESGQRFVYQTVSQNIPVIDVYLGFMDEEVNARLNKLIEIEKGKKKDDERRPVILIERGQIEPDDPILEWRLGNYKVEPTRIIQVSPKGEMVRHTKRSSVSKFFHGGKDSKKTIKISPEGKKEDKSIDPEKILGRAIAAMMEYKPASDLDWVARGLKVKRYFDLIKLLQHRLGSKTKSKLPGNATGKGPYLSVVRFDVGNNNNAPIIVIRTPEMGLQPSLMCPYIAFLFKAISAMSSQLAHERKHKWEWPLRVSQFGAQGSSSNKKEYQTGKMVEEIFASLFVGVEIASDITVTAKEGDKKTAFTYQSSGDSEAAPSWEATDAKSREDKWLKEKVPYESTKQIPEGKQLPKEAYHEYAVSGSKTHLKAFAVISLCTPAGVYDFFREEISGPENVKLLMEKFDIANNLINAIDTNYASDKEWDKPEDAKGKETYVLRRRELLDLVRYSRELGPDEKIEAAQLVAGSIFRWSHEHENLKVTNYKHEKDSPYYGLEKDIKSGMKLPELMERVREKYKDRYPRGEISLTGSYFVGEDDKAVADKLGINGVAMEDYHVLRVLRSAIAKGDSPTSDYPIIMQWRIDRINCDPKELDPLVLAKFDEYIKQPYLSVKDYIDVICWGKGGVLKEKVPDCAKWKLVDEIREITSDDDEDLGKKLLKQHLWSYVVESDPAQKGKYWVTDPFCIEIATDFVNELSEIEPWAEKPGGIAKIDSAILEAICEGKEVENAKRKLKEAKEKFKKDPKISGKALWADIAQEDKKYKKKCELLLINCIKEDEVLRKWLDHIKELRQKALAVRNEKGVSKARVKAEELMKFVEKWCCYDSGKTKNGNGSEKLLKTWLRPGKWKGVTAASLQDLGDDKFGGAAVDRAFYKSCNMMALQTMAGMHIYEDR